MNPQSLAKEIGHSQLKKLPMTDQMMNDGDFSPDIPDEMKLLIADLHISWGHVDTLARWWGYYQYRDYGGTASAKDFSFWDRYTVYKKTMRLEKEKGVESFSLLPLYGLDRHVITVVRNTLAHAHLFGMLNKPYELLLFYSFEDDGRVARHAYPRKLIEAAVKRLKLQASTLEADIEGFKKFVSTQNQSADNTSPPSDV